jgi:hypothetical protein
VELISFRIAAGLVAVLALGFGIPGVIGAVHLARTGEIWRLWGFPTYGPANFGKWGVPVSPTLILAFSAVCALALGAAALLWFPSTALVGAIAAIVLLAAQAVFWIGFDLPFGPPLALLAVAAIAVGLVSSGVPSA